MENIMDLPLRRQFQLIGSVSYYMFDREWSKAFGSQLKGWMRHLKVFPF
jgi:hypothetical protein